MVNVTHIEIEICAIKPEATRDEINAAIKSALAALEAIADTDYVVEVRTVTTTHLD